MSIAYNLYMSKF